MKGDTFVGVGDRLVVVLGAGSSHDCVDTATVAVTGWSDNETVDGVEMNGSGQPDPQQGPDVVPGSPGMGPDSAPVQTTAQVRAERSGRGSGRVYTLTVRCSETDGDSGTADITVSVPHDQGNH